DGNAINGFIAAEHAHVAAGATVVPPGDDHHAVRPWHRRAADRSAGAAGSAAGDRDSCRAAVAGSAAGSAAARSWSRSAAGAAAVFSSSNDLHPGTVAA